MKKTSFVLGVLLAALATIALGTGTAAFGQSAIPFQRGNPVVNGCAAGLEAIQVSDFPSDYRGPARIDDPANGGNGDGVICAKPWTPAEQAARLPDATVQIFNFTDNTLTRAH